MSLGEMDAARQTVAQFVAANRDSATAHACEAILLAEDDKPREAVDALPKGRAAPEVAAEEEPPRGREELERERRLRQRRDDARRGDRPELVGRLL